MSVKTLLLATILTSYGGLKRLDLKSICTPLLATSTKHISGPLEK